MRSIVLTEEDFENERRLYKEERIFPITYENMFFGGFRCIMSALEKWQKLYMLNKQLLDRGLTTPEAIKKNEREFREVTEKHRLGRVMSNRLYDFTNWWETQDLPKRMMDDINNGRKKGFELRDETAHNAPGMSWKISTYWVSLMDYPYLVAVDKWMLQLLRNRGYRYNGRKIKIPDIETTGSPDEKEYKTYEIIARNLAARYDLTPAQFQRIVWIKSSGWKPR